MAPGSQRLGSEKDCDKLNETFTKRGFTITIRQDLDAQVLCHCLTQRMQGIFSQYTPMILLNNEQYHRFPDL